MAVTAAVASVVVAAGTAGYSSYQASQAKSEAIDEKGRQEKLAEKAANDATAVTNQEKADIKAANDAATARDSQNMIRLAQQRRRAQFSDSSTMKGGTILTGPQGLSGPANTATKTLLGQ